jgi:hypothetical protein
MAKIERFEDIESWQTARGAVQAIYRATGDAIGSMDPMDPIDPIT